jgi:hypothetical protein
MKFKSKKELFKYLVENKQELIDARKSVIKYSDCVTIPFETTKEFTTKAKYPYENDEEKGILKRTVVANTYNWLDSHGDVHLDGTFARSISNGSRKAHLHDHYQQLDGRVGKPISFSEKEISWRELGQGKTGMTQALVMETEVRRSLNEKVYQDYLNDEVDQHSVGMQYVKITLAVNDEDNYPNEYKVWKDVIGRIGNRAKAEEQGFFWAVSEAKLFEVSAVLFGSNELTPTLGGGKSQSVKSTEFVLEEPSNDTRLLEALNKLSIKIKNGK